MQFLPLFLVSLTLLFTSARPAHAQIEERGEARIRNESSVTVRIESGAAMDAEKLSLVSGVLGAALARVRTCYEERSAENPTLQGRVRAVVRLGPPAEIEIDREELDDEGLRRCVRQTLTRVDRATLPRPPGTAYVFIDFASDAASAVEAMRERAAEEGAAPVTRDEHGVPSATGGLPNRLVTFRVEGSPETPDAQLQAVHRAVRAQIPTLLDCRRRAGRRTPPAGTMHFRVVAGRRTRVRAGHSSVEDSRGPRCVSRVLERASYDAEARGTTTVVVEFANEPLTPPPAAPPTN